MIQCQRLVSTIIDNASKVFAWDKEEGEKANAFLSFDMSKVHEVDITPDANLLSNNSLDVGEDDKHAYSEGLEDSDAKADSLFIPPSRSSG